MVTQILIYRENWEKVIGFTYLGSTLAKDVHLYEEITHKVRHDGKTKNVWSTNQLEVQEKAYKIEETPPMIYSVRDYDMGSA